MEVDEIGTGGQSTGKAKRINSCNGCFRRNHARCDDARVDGMGCAFTTRHEPNIQPVRRVGPPIDHRHGEPDALTRIRSGIAYGDRPGEGDVAIHSLGEGTGSCEKQGEGEERAEVRHRGRRLIERDKERTGALPSKKGTAQGRCGSSFRLHYRRAPAP